MANQFRYYMPNMNNSNGYDIRIIDITNDEHKKQLKKDYERLCELQKEKVEECRSYYNKRGNIRVTLPPSSSDDSRLISEGYQRIFCNFILIKNKKGEALQYTKDCFKLISMYEELYTPDTVKSKEPIILPVSESEGFDVLWHTFMDKLNSLLSILGFKINQDEPKSDAVFMVGKKRNRNDALIDVAAENEPIKKQKYIQQDSYRLIDNTNAQSQKRSNLQFFSSSSGSSQLATDITYPANNQTL